jgi:hypothetical protein
VPYNVPADGVARTAAYELANWTDQVISTVTSSTRPSSPPEGQRIYETDTDREYTWNGSAWVQQGGTGVWTSYTPTVTQSGAVTVTVTYSRYNKIGRTVVWSCSVAVTGSGSASNAIVFTLPVTAAVSGPIVGAGILNDAGVGFYGLNASLASTTTLVFYPQSATATTTAVGGAGGGFTAGLAATDAISFSVTYESAA